MRRIEPEHNDAEIEYVLDLQVSADHIMRDALHIIGLAYGEKPQLRPDDNGQASAKPYRNRRHAVAVRDRALYMAAESGFEPVQRTVAGLAATAHAVEIKDGLTESHVASASWLVKQMRNGGFDSYQVADARMAVLGAELIYDDDGAIIRQKTARTNYTNQRSRSVAATVASADIAGLFLAGGPYQSHLMYFEDNQLTVTDELDTEALAEFQQNAIRTVERYSFPNNIAPRLFGGLRGQVAHYHSELLEKLDSGEVETYADVLDNDIAFAHKHM